MGLDAVEIVMTWEDSLGVTITDQEAAFLRTPRLAVDLICRKLEIDINGPSGGCLTQSAFYRLRRAFIAAFGCPREAVTPHVRLSVVTPGWNTREGRRRLSAETGIPTWPNVLFGVALPSPLFTFADLARFLVAEHAYSLRHSAEGWTRGQVREVVRIVVSEQLGIKKFGDDDDFVHDLGID